MKTADYEVVSDLVVQDRTGDGISRAERRVEGFQRHAARAGRNITSYFQGAFAAVGGLGLLAGATRGVIGFHTEIETARSGLASLFSAFDGSPIEQSLGRARGVLSGLRKDAAAGVGELTHYAQGFQAIFGATGGRVSDSVVRDLTRNAIAAGFALRGQEGMQLAPLDIQQALSGALGDRTTPIAIRALQAAGVSADEFRAMDVEGKIDALNRGFATFEGGVKLMGQTWDAQASTMVDSIKEITRTATEPVFERWKSRLTEANQWLDRNRDVVQDMAERWGQRLLGVWDHLIGSARTYVALLAAAAAIQAAPGASLRVQGGLGSLAQAGGFVGPMGARGLPMRDLFSRGGLAATGKGLLKMAPKLAKGTGILALVAAAIDGMIGAWTEFPSAAKWVTLSVGNVTDAFSDLIESLGSWSGEGSILNRIGAAFLWVGGVVLHVVAGVIRFGATLFRAGGLILTIVGRLTDALWGLVTFDRDLVQSSLAGIGDEGRSFMRDLSDIWSMPEDPRRKKADEAAGEAGPTDGPGGGIANNLTVINVDQITVRAEVNEDPARIARAFDEIVDRSRRFATGPRRLATFGGA